MTQTTITITMSNGDTFKIEGQDDQDESRQRTYEWAGRNVVWSEDGDDFIQLKGWRFKRAFVNRRQIISVVLDGPNGEAKEDFWSVF